MNESRHTQNKAVTPFGENGLHCRFLLTTGPEQMPDGWA
jgi:hypothetical protein